MVMDIIDDFRYQYRWLSNFHVAEVYYEGLRYPSTEHAYQAAKSLDPLERIRIANLPMPRDAKKYGKTVVLRPDWEEIKDRVMFDVCFQKFTNHPDLRQALLDTGDAELIEGNTWGDTYWGVCKGVGRNKLGWTLMKIREVLKYIDTMRNENDEETV